MLARGCPSLPAPSAQVIIYACVGLGCFLFIVGYPTLWRIFVTFPISCFMFIGRWGRNCTVPHHALRTQATGVLVVTSRLLPLLPCPLSPCPLPPPLLLPTTLLCSSHSVRPLSQQDLSSA